MSKVVIVLGSFLLFTATARSDQTLYGLEDLKFGMDQSAAASSANAGGARNPSIDCWELIGRPPYDPCFLSFTKTIDGLDWFVFVFFISQQGIGKIELRTHSTFSGSYNKYRELLSTKYGQGIQTTRSRPGLCDELGQARSAGLSSRYISWIAPEGFSYLIRAQGGTIELTSKRDSLCWNASTQVRHWFEEENRTSRYLRPTLSIIYERTPTNVYRDRSRLRSPSGAQQNVAKVQP